MFSSKPRIMAGLAAAVSLLALQATPALAFDPTGNAVADAFLSLLDSEEGTVEGYGSVSESGGSITIADIVLSDEDDEDTTVKIGSTVLAGGEILQNGRLKLDSLDLARLALDSDDGGMSVANISVIGLVLPSPQEAEAGGSSAGPGYQSFEATTIQIREEENKVADIGKISSSIDTMDGDLPTSARFAVTDAVIDVNQIESDEAKSLSELGYETLSINISGSGKWDPEAATAEVPDLKLDIKDAASLSVSLSLGGVTKEVVAELNKVSGKPEEAMGVLQNITVNNASIRLDDESLTGRILDQEAEKAGVEAPVYVSRITGSLPLMLGILQNKELEGQVSDAVTEFLTTPGSLELTATPENPVTVAQIMGTAILSPQMIPQILSVGITANQ